VDGNEEPRSQDVTTSADTAEGGVVASDDDAQVALAEPQGPADVEGTVDVEGSAKPEAPADVVGSAEHADVVGSAEPEAPADVEGATEPDGPVETAGDGVGSATTGLEGAEESVSAEPPVEAVAAEPAEAPAADPAATDAPIPSRRRVSLRRGAAVAAAVLVGALAVSAFSTVVPSSGDADQHFVDTARSQGRVVAAGGQQALLVSAARKICDRRGSHATVAQRRATALSSDELAVIQRTFAGDTRGFTALAIDTYCPR
jgi:transcription termination factor Rho